MSVLPPMVPRRHSGVRVMITPGEQLPPGGLPIYTNSAKGIFISFSADHSAGELMFCVSKFALLALFFLCSENGASREANHTSAESEVVCTCINGSDILFYD